VCILDVTTITKHRAMTVTKIESGQYKVVCKAGTFIVAQLFNSYSNKPYGWDVYVNEKRNDTAWAWVFKTKREAIESIKELEENN